MELLEITRNVWTWLDIAKKNGYGLIYLEMAGNGWKCLEIVRHVWHCWIWLEMAENGWKWFEMGWPNLIFWDLESSGYEN